ncbi:MAG: triose-phosphate isomerase [Nitrososphaeraceae archaeon]|nr:triose-phosphate isomerase [Nitrososphaeraceae archaeon]
MKQPLIINFKNYEDVSADRAINLAESARQVAEKLKIEIVVAPPQPALALIAKKIQIPVICQHVDNEKMGPSTGFVVPEIAKSYGAIGSLINHSEHRIEMSSIASLVERMRKLGMVSIVCAQEPNEVVEISILQPDFIAIEPPELIGSGRAVSKENPAIITKSIQGAGSRSSIICGAGITDKDDVARAMELGSQGILVASGIVKANSWEKKIAELASGMKG